ncbi:GDP-mannose-dependent alpha-(1-2)-phosphatidylinositol mannosyltransferase [Corynebacterium frankenforstense DSM 45800]|uniref:GDP-mannose-dependent alpha-(1-2)-phosphatidylinositol mannosyltransferase n=1 Tax=Corynebacterium frankenforstense DSM 45800 TaxID=1437875 RepID=A0A1L7CS88_9CORY|nr:glycosyltransferase family 4 protein [Corynebacterium frankenforstense]APT88725.1 GDP-mannose-dependent alpha-(1-2)-phosphatidylinositol mannosyltransferase [Corynebacterium frankenforstense DSM 45800]
MRVGLVCPYSFDEPGGVQAHVLELGAQLRARGHHVEAIGPASETADVPGWVHRGGPAIPIPYNGSVARLSIGPQVRRRVDRFLTEGDFDVLHIHEPNSPSYSMVALARARGPIVATYHASASGSRVLKAALPVLRPLLEKVRGGIAVSEMARRWQVEQLGGDPVLIPNGVDTGVFARARREAEQAAADAPASGAADAATGAADAATGVDGPRGDGTEPTRPVELVFLGRLDESRKGLDVLLAALETMRSRTPVHVTVIGSGRARPARGVRYVGRVSDAEKARLLAQADIYVAPNLGGESFGIVLVEAMAAGCAVVASDLEAFNAVCAGDTARPAGALFATGDSAALAATLDRLVDDPAARKGLAAAGRARAERYDWRTVTRQVLAVYETVTDGTKVTVR